LHLRDQRERGQEAPVAEDGSDVFVSRDHVTHRRTSQPVALASLGEDGEGLIAFEIDQLDLGQLQIVHGDGHLVPLCASKLS
jgi:hypothetical protein